MENYIEPAISVVNIILAVIMMQMKSMKGILIFQIICNMLTASAYLVCGGDSGAGICVIAIVQTVTMFIYNLKKVPPHKAVIIGFIALYVGWSALSFKSFADIFSAAAALCFALSVVQTKASLSRIWYLFNPVCWLIFDIFTQAYGTLTLHSIVLCSTVIGILRNDVKRKSK